MRTRYQQMTSSSLDGYSNFIGNDEEYRNWFGVIGRSRDSDALERSNFRVALELLGGEGQNVLIGHYGHWAVGWIEEIYVRPETTEFLIAQDIEFSMSNYPILDEDDFCNEEQNEAYEVWKNCYNDRERLAYIRKCSDQFDFRDFREIRENVRGDSFIGYASDLLA